MARSTQLVLPVVGSLIEGPVSDSHILVSYHSELGLDVGDRIPTDRMWQNDG